MVSSEGKTSPPLRISAMSTTTEHPPHSPADLAAHCRAMAERARQAAIELGGISTERKAAGLLRAAAEIRADTALILAANRADLEASAGAGLTAAAAERLLLDEKRVEGIAAGIEAVAALPDPVGEVIESSIRPSGLTVCKIRVPLGVIFFIYESRPNVTADAAAVALAAGNAIILRGGKEAARSSRAIVESVRRGVAAAGLPVDGVQLVDTADRAAVGEFLKLDTLIDLAIPRGGEQLIRRVCAEARMPVLKHFNGNCHVYVDRAADLAMARAITVNAKCQRMGVCNAAESLLVHREVAAAFLPEIGTASRSSATPRRASSSPPPVLPPRLTSPPNTSGRKSRWRSSTHSTRPSITSTATAPGTPMRS